MKFYFHRRSTSVKENMKHEKIYNEIARERYHNVMCFYLNRDVEFRKADFVIQPHLLWIVVTPDGLISDASPNSDIEDFVTLISLMKKTKA